MNEEYKQMIKQQLAAMGMDPKMMDQYLENFNINDMMNQAMSSPFMQNYGSFDSNSYENDTLNLFDDDTPYVKEDNDLTPEEERAILVSAPLSFVNGLYINTLSTYGSTDEIIENLESWWDITSRKDFEETVDWLSDSGHSVYFDAIWKMLVNTPKPEWRGAIQSLEMQALASDTIKPDRIKDYAQNILACYSTLVSEDIIQKDKVPTIKGWDLVRIVDLCKFTYDAGYITREEALFYAKKYADELKNIFNSWEELANSYLLGFSMWNGDEDDLDYRLEQVLVLLEHPDSLWKKVKW